MTRFFKSGFILLIFLISCSKPSPEEKELELLSEKYSYLTVIDVHNHDSPYVKHCMRTLWKKYGIDKVVLFGGYISRPEAEDHDKKTLEAYEKYPDRIIPFFAALDIHNENIEELVKNNFNKGFKGIGEIVAASTYSPITSNAEWKGQHPMDAGFPKVYKLCAEYNKPILLHIDPPTGDPITQLEIALDSFPDTRFIYAHANGYNSPDVIRQLLLKHNNLYIDYFAGFDEFNEESNYTMDDYVLVINEFPDRFMVSTDSGYDIGQINAYLAIFRLLDKLEEGVREKVAGKNFESLYE